jgi:predicted MFS family arabinose efflux permease
VYAFVLHRNVNSWTLKPSGTSLHVLFSLALFLGFMGVYVPFFYTQSFALENHIMSSHLAFYMLAVLNAASVCGRIVPSFRADRFGPINVLVPCCAISAVLAFSWTAVHDTAGVVVFCIFYGFFSGSFVSLQPTVIVTLAPSLSVVGTWMGMSFAFAAVALLIGSPVAGAILDSGGWLGLQAFCGACVAAATAACIVVKFAKSAAMFSKT